MSVAAFLMLCLTCILSRSATACIGGVDGPTSFTATPGSSQSQTWIADNGGLGLGGTVSISITAGSDVFSIDQSTVIIPSTNDTAHFTITFKPGANATGTFKGTLTCPCGKTYELTGTVAASGVANPLPSDVSISITPNPATNYFTVAASGVRRAEIGIYDLLGKEIAFPKSATLEEIDNTASKNSTWKWDASNLATGSYIVRVTGESFSGEQFVLSRRIIISR